MKMDEIQINNNAIELRKHFGEDSGSAIDVFAIVENSKDITLIYHTLDESISGMCLKLTKNKIIVVNSKMSNGRQRFTVAHELCHLFFDKEEKYICTMNIDSRCSDVERRADDFASYFLAPYGSFIEKANEFSTITNKDKLQMAIMLEQYFRISHKATLVRLMKEKYINQKEYDSLSLSYPSKIARDLGYDTTLYQPRKNKENFTIGNYIRLANRLNKKGLISDAKREEMLIEAYRSDVVFGDDDVEIND